MESAMVAASVIKRKFHNFATASIVLLISQNPICSVLVLFIIFPHLPQVTVLVNGRQREKNNFWGCEYGSV